MQPLENCIGPTIRIGREILCLPYAGFFCLGLDIFRCASISRSDDRYRLTNRLIDWKFTVPQIPQIPQISSLQMECHSKGESLKMKCH